MTATHRIHRNKGTEQGEAIRQIRKDVFLVESFSEPGKFYKVDLAKDSCKCGAHVYGPGCVKHVVLTDAVSAIPAGVGSDIAVERVTDLCRAIFDRSPITAHEAYMLFLGTAAAPYTTLAMVTAARIKLRRSQEIVSGLAVA